MEKQIKVVLSRKEPLNKHVLWLKPNSLHEVSLKIYNNEGWQDLKTINVPEELLNKVGELNDSVKEFDKEIDRFSVSINSFRDDLITETQQRMAVDSSLGNRITSVTTTANNNKTNLNNLETNLNTNLANLIAKDKELETAISNLQKEDAQLTNIINAKQDELMLTVLDNGNIRIGNLQGQTNEFMPATPSGDPMHYAYEEMGAVYNTEDSIEETPWASLVDDADYNAQWGLNLIQNNATFIKNVNYNGVDREVWQMVHPSSNRLVWVVAIYSSDGKRVWDDTLFVARKNRWKYICVGDLPNEEINNIYNQGIVSIQNEFARAYINNPRYSGFKGVTNRLFYGNIRRNYNLIGSLYGCQKVEFNLLRVSTSTTDSFVVKASEVFSTGNTRHINTYGITPTGGSIANSVISTVPIYAKSNFELKSNNISKKTILFAINNAAKPTSGNITIKLPTDAYNRLSNDDDIISALQSQDFILLST